jgi:hypothetical protein
MRLKQRRKVDLPQPEGPISAVTWFFSTGKVDALQGLEIAIVEVERIDLRLEFGPAVCGGGC